MSTARARRSGSCFTSLLLWASAILTPVPAWSCVGEACLQIWSTEAGGGALALRYDFSQKVQTFFGLCGGSQCLYSTIDPGFMAEVEDPPGGTYFRLVDGTTVKVELVSADAGVAMSFGVPKLQNPGDSVTLGTMPTIHNHPTWQLVVPRDTIDDYRISYKLTTDSPLYSESAVYTSTVTNIEPPPGSPSPTASPTATPTPCVGDCNGDGRVGVDELVRGVNIALSGSSTVMCSSLDRNLDSLISVDELILAVNTSLNGCPMVRVVSFEEIQQTIFTPRCATRLCHDSASANSDLVLESGSAFDEIVNVAPFTAAARDAGLLRVAPGDPDRSFLLSKLLGPPRGQGSRMPLTGDPLTGEEIDLVRTWILQGAAPPDDGPQSQKLGTFNLALRRYFD